MRILFFLSMLLLVACKQDAPEDKLNDATEASATKKYFKFSGKTMGTMYNITIGRESKGIQKKVDQLLLEINDELSTYIPSATISKINSADKKFAIQDTKDYVNRNKHFKKVFSRSKEIYKMSEGSFEPTIMPLVNYWGFGPKKKKPQEVDKEAIKNLISLVDFSEVKKEVSAQDQKLYITKPSKEVQLDFSAIAKGYAVDQLAFLLEQNGIGNYLVDIGGEVKARGFNANNKRWSIAVNTPKINTSTSDAFKILSLENISVASSGNYRNYFKLDNVVYSHTLNPKTGFPERNELLSSTVFANDCMTADAFATACMVSGFEKAKSMIEKYDEVEAYFIYSDSKGELKEHTSRGAIKHLKKEE